METTSVSQGSFLFLPKNFKLSKLRRSRKRKLIDEGEEKWEKVFNSVWSIINSQVKIVYEDLFKKVLRGLINHIRILHKEIKLDEGILPCEILLTGTNLPDHNLLLSALTDNIKEVTPYISVLWSRNCGNIKNTVTSFVKQIISSKSDFDKEDTDSECSDSDTSLDESKSKVVLQISQYNLPTLSAWHSAQEKKEGVNYPVVIFIPDFESFSPKVLTEFVQILSYYSTKVPLVLVFGVATTPGIVYQSLPQQVLSQLSIQLFKSESSMSFLNQVVEKILFSEKCPFRLGSKCMTFLTDIFLFHSFSVQGFIQGFKYCMMEHFYKRNHYALCCFPDDLESQVNALENEELEQIRRIPSFQRHVEDSPKDVRALLLLNNDHTKKVVKEMVSAVQEHLSAFHVALKCLHILTQDLPQYPLGRHLREYYCNAISSDVKESSEYKECMKALKFQGTNELSRKLSLILDLLKSDSTLDKMSRDKSEKFKAVTSQLDQFKSKLDEMSANDKTEDYDDGTGEFGTTRNSILEYLEKKLFGEMVGPVVSLPLHETILFDDLPGVRRRISGSPRGAIHLALNNPQYYLECECCKLPHAEAVLPTLPDLSIAYKLHLEFGKVINIYDWMQAFAACVKPDQTESETEKDEELQARFTRALSEIQFLGFIKPSRSKSDYVTRLTWGSS